MRAFAVLLFAIGVFGAVGPGEAGGAAGASRHPFAIRGRFVRVVDATTVQVQIARQTRLVRVIGVKAAAGDCRSLAVAALHGATPWAGEKVVLRGDRALPRSDGQGHLLAYVDYYDGSLPRDLGLVLLSEGAVTVDRTHHFRRLASYSKAERSARTSGLGIWSTGKADLALTAISPTGVNFGAPFTLSATITNNGPSDAQAVASTWKGPVAVGGVDWSATSSDPFGGNGHPGPYDLGGCTTTTSILYGGYGEPIPPKSTVSCVDPYLPAADSWQIQITTRGSFPNLVRSDFAVHACTADPDQTNNTATVTTNVIPPGP